MFFLCGSLVAHRDNDSKQTGLTASDSRNWTGGNTSLSSFISLPFLDLGSTFMSKVLKTNTSQQLKMCFQCSVSMVFQNRNTLCFITLQ